MRPISKVLAPIDLSVDPERPVAHAINIAKAIGAELTLLYVASQRPSKRIVRFRWPSNASEFHRLVLPGNPVETISRYADFIEADLLAMSSNNYGRWSRLWKRSTTGEVMKFTRRPVCVTDSGSIDPESSFDCRRILCALKLDGSDDPLILHAESLAQRSGADLLLLGVVPDLDEGLLLQTITGVDRPLSAKLALERIRELGTGISVPWRTSVVTGSPYKCIRAAAREHSADLVMATRALPCSTEWDCFDMRSIFSRLSRPLVTVRPNWVAPHTIADDVEAGLTLERVSSF
jgi:nucleotide-binding universal stress UspA family protein